MNFLGNRDENDFYLYLEFGGKISNDVFDEPIHLRIENLHKENPLVQLNERVFRGTFDHAMGTNLFFETTDNQTQLDILGRKTSVHLDYFASQTKVLNLEPVKIKPRKPEISPDQYKIKYNLKWDYETLLKKWDDGTLDLKDMIKNVQVVPAKEKLQETIEQDDDEEHVEVAQPDQILVEKKVNQTDEKLARELKEKYQRLKLLAKRPVKRKIIEEAVHNCNDKYKKAYELHNIEKQLLQPSLTFRTPDIREFNEKTITDCIDINRCILYGILKPSTASPRILTSKEKTAVLNLQNFDNLSLSARYYVINSCIEKMERQVENMSDEKLKQQDEYGRTLQDTLELYKNLSRILFKRLTEIKTSISEMTVSDDNATL